MDCVRPIWRATFYKLIFWQRLKWVRLGLNWIWFSFQVILLYFFIILSYFIVFFFIYFFFFHFIFLLIFAIPGLLYKFWYLVALWWVCYCLYITCLIEKRKWLMELLILSTIFIKTLSIKRLIISKSHSQSLCSFLKLIKVFKTKA